MNPVLKESVDLMLSDNYKDRFVAEYMQLKNRYEGLQRMMQNWENNNLKFTPTCSKEVYKIQLKAMKEYLDILEYRASKEEVKLC